MKKFRIAAFNYHTTYLNIIKRALEELGHEVLLIDLKEISLPNIARQIKTFHPDFCFSIDFKVFELFDRDRFLEETLEALQIPTVVWFTDDPRYPETFAQSLRWQFGPYPRQMFFLVASKEHVNFFKSKNMPAARLLTCVDENLKNFRPTEAQRKKFAGGPFFTGRPLLPSSRPLAREELREFHRWFALNFMYQRLAQIQPGALDQVRDFMLEIYPYVKTFFDSEIASHEAYAIHQRRFEDDVSSHLSPDFIPFIKAFWYQIGHIYSWFRLSDHLYELKNAVSLRVFGGEDWRNVLAYSGSLDPQPPEDFYATMALSTVTFCFTKFQLYESVHERVGMAYLTGGFPVTDWRENLDLIFQPDEYVSYRTLDEAKDKIRFYHEHPHLREKIAAKGRERVLMECNYRKRMGELLALVQKEWDL